ncbi:UDP-N-acetyl-D-mannosaminuronic acid dehydrogenase [Candidatus Magnetobacterium bavaricum]|uniref:UDP-N-acetyl-D-mannosaminuronic acid dehydrogenase n=1 Tax=Candidatus Magnetobacterium bavaricum TaxID=29290 RepID=A0A0F3GJS5_9BACT|nr:UDP-N-acetyl-D-mannosaminuronic acid dehydrogenase [Candidatus Magnetobacterium bavaricum]
MLSKYSELLLSREAKLGIWGLGYLGYSDLTRYAMNGVKCVVSDYNPERLMRMEKEFLPEDTLLAYLDILPKNVDIASNVEVKKEYEELLHPDILIHIFSVPTQNKTQPTNKWLMEALKVFIRVVDVKYTIPPVLILESSLIPGTMDRMILPFLRENGLLPGENILVGLCSRRDWFDEKGKVLDFPRIVSGVTKETTDIVAEIIEIAGATVIKASDYRIAEVLKCVENSYQQIETTIANQLAMAFPDIDIRETLRLATIRSNIPYALPNFGTGGYDIPIACQYVMEGATIPEYLTLFRETNYADQSMPKIISEVILRRKVKNVGFLGISYKSNVGISAMSPGMLIIEYLKGKIGELKCYDPFYSPEEVNKLLGISALSFPEELLGMEAIIVNVGHSAFRRVPWCKLKEKLINCLIVLDNMGIWADLPWDETNIIYHMIGSAGWDK